MNTNVRIYKVILLFFIVIGVVGGTALFAILHHDDGVNEISFSLIDPQKNVVTQDDFIGGYQIVIFGFTGCHNICPTQMSRLTAAINQLESKNQAKNITPVFISVDADRDSPEKVGVFIEHFHKRFVGLTGSEVALKNTANSFKAVYQSRTDRSVKDYQITHSSVIYIVNPLNQIVDAIPGDNNAEEISQRIVALLNLNG